MPEVMKQSLRSLSGGELGQIWDWLSSNADPASIIAELHREMARNLTDKLSRTGTSRWNATYYRDKE